MPKISERNVIRLMLKVGPWLAPFGTMFAVKRSVAAHFQFPDIVAWPTAIVIEVLGIGTIYLMLVMDDWNRKRSEKSKDLKARAGLAKVLVCVYILTTIVLVILLDVLPELNRWALAVLPLVSVVAYAALSLFAEFEHMEQEKQARKTAVKAVNVSKFDEKLDRLLTFYADTPNLTPTEAARQMGCSRGSIYNYLNVLEQRGRIENNGEGVKVLQ